MADPHFSIATPTRNALVHLRRCIGSVRGQVGVTREHLVQDALSDDGSPAWLASQADVAAVSERDKGMYDAINRAWNRSRGQVLSWLNADEQYLPGTLACVDAYFRDHPDVDVVFGDYVVADPEGRPIALRQEIPFRRRYVVNGFLNTMSCTLFFRRHLFEAGDLVFDSSYRYAADKELMLRLADRGAVIRRIPRYLSIFGVDGSNLSTHPGMAAEAESIRLAHGAFRSGWARQAVMAGRRLERLIGGAYWPRATGYRYALDERPTYLDVDASGAGGRYGLNAAGKAGA